MDFRVFLRALQIYVIIYLIILKKINLYLDIQITHISKIKELIWTTSIALTKGASFIEKHVCINQKSKPPDYISALEFKEFNIYIKETKAMFLNIFKNSLKLSKGVKI